MKKFFDKVPTGLYTRKAMIVMKKLTLKIRDCYNNRTIFNAEIATDVTILDVYNAVDFKMTHGEVILDPLLLKKSYNSSIGNMPKNEMLKTIACAFKKVVKAISKKESPEFVSNANLICDVLSGNSISKYNKKQVESIVGQPLSPMAYEMIDSHAELLKEFDNECQLKIDEVRRKANAEIAKIKSIYKAKIKDANQTLNTALRGQNM